LPRGDPAGAGGAVLLGPLAWRVVNEIDFTRGSVRRHGASFGTAISVRTAGRMLYGGRISLAVGFAACCRHRAGTLIGAISGISRGSATPC